LKLIKIGIVEYIMILHSGHSNFKMTFLYIEFKINDYHGKQCGCNKHKNHCVFFILRSYI